MSHNRVQLRSTLAAAGACCALAAASQTAQAQPECFGFPSCYTVRVGGGGSCGCRMSCISPDLYVSLDPLFVGADSCTSTPNQGEHTFLFHEGIARPGYLFVSSSVHHAATENIFAVMGGSATFRHEDVIFTGPAGATSVQVTFAMTLDTAFASFDEVPHWEARVNIGGADSSPNGAGPVQGQIVSVTQTIDLDGGSPVSHSLPQTISAYVLELESAHQGGDSSGMARFKTARGCEGEVFTFSLPGCSASSVSAGISGNRLPPDSDYNGDGFVDGIDSDQFYNDFEAGDINADYNHDGIVDGIDSDMFNNDFEAGC